MAARTRHPHAAGGGIRRREILTVAKVGKGGGAIVHVLEVVVDGGPAANGAEQRA